MEQRNQEENSVWINDKKRLAAIQRQSVEERQRKIEREIARMCTVYTSCFSSFLDAHPEGQGTGGSCVCK
jgi:hypothetical protein